MTPIDVHQLEAVDGDRAIPGQTKTRPGPRGIARTPPWWQNSRQRLEQLSIVGEHLDWEPEGFERERVASRPLTGSPEWPLLRGRVAGQLRHFHVVAGLEQRECIVKSAGREVGGGVVLAVRHDELPAYPRQPNAHLDPRVAEPEGWRRCGQAEVVVEQDKTLEVGAGAVVKSLVDGEQPPSGDADARGAATERTRKRWSLASDDLLKLARRRIAYVYDGWSA